MIRKLSILALAISLTGCCYAMKKKQISHLDTIRAVADKAARTKDFYMYPLYLSTIRYEADAALEDLRK